MRVKQTTTTKDLSYKLKETAILEPEGVHSGNISNGIRIKIFPEKEKQKVIGMGYSFEHSSCFNFLQLSKKDRIEALKLLIDPKEGAGMNLWRLCIGTSDFTSTSWYSYCDDPPKNNSNPVVHVEKNFNLKQDKKLILPVLYEALKLYPHLKFFSSPWSPPAWMKDSQSLCGGKLLKKYWSAYATYLAKYVEVYLKLGIPIKAITIQNEPLHNTTSMPSCKWDWKGREERDFLKNFLGPTFMERGLLEGENRVEIWIYDHNFDDIPFRTAKYPQTILKDKAAAKFVDGIAFHHYSALGWSNPKLLRKIRKKFPEMPFYFSEGSVFGLWGSLRLSRYLKYGCSSYNGWVPMLDTEGKPNKGPFSASKTLLQRKVSDNNLLINFDYYMHVHFSKFIQPNAVQVEVSRPRRWGFEVVAFQNPNGKLVCIFINKRRWARKITVKCGEKHFKAKLMAKSINTFEFL